MTVLFALASVWVFVNAALLVGMWPVALRDTRGTWHLSPRRRQRLTVLLLTAAPVGVARWAFLRGQPWQRRAMVQFLAGLPVVFVVLMIWVAAGR